MAGAIAERERQMREKMEEEFTARLVHMRNELLSTISEKEAIILPNHHPAMVKRVKAMLQTVRAEEQERTAYCIHNQIRAKVMSAADRERALGPAPESSKVVY